VAVVAAPNELCCAAPPVPSGVLIQWWDAAGPPGRRQRSRALALAVEGFLAHFVNRAEAVGVSLAEFTYLQVRGGCTGWCR